MAEPTAENDACPYYRGDTDWQCVLPRGHARASGSGGHLNRAEYDRENRVIPPDKGHRADG